MCDPTCLKGVALVERMRNRHQGTGRESGQPGRRCCDDIGADGLGLSWGSGGGGPSGQIPEYSAGRAGLELTAERERERERSPLHSHLNLQQGLPTLEKGKMKKLEKNQPRRPLAKLCPLFCLSSYGQSQPCWPSTAPIPGPAAPHPHPGDAGAFAGPERPVASSPW